MKKTFIAVIVCVVVLLAFLAFAWAQRNADSRISTVLGSIPGIEVAYSARSGNILTGFTLKDITISRVAHGSGVPLTTFTTPRVRLGLTHFPIALKSVSWDRGTVTLSPGTDAEAVIQIGHGGLTPVSTGQALSGSGIQIGDQSWGGMLDMAFGRDGSGFSGSINFDKLPATELAIFGFDPALLSHAGNIQMNIEISDTPELTDISGTMSVSLRPTGNEPGTLSTSSINILFGLEPLRITEISWDPGSFTASHPDGRLEVINFGAGKLIPEGRTLLKLESEIPVGPASWNARMSLTLGARLENIDARIYIDNLPADSLDLFTDVPESFPSGDTVAVNLVITNTPEGIRTHGNVFDPLTRESFTF